MILLLYFEFLIIISLEFDAHLMMVWSSFRIRFFFSWSDAYCCGWVCRFFLGIGGWLTWDDFWHYLVVIRTLFWGVVDVLRWGVEICWSLLLWLLVHYLHIILVTTLFVSLRVYLLSVLDISLYRLGWLGLSILLYCFYYVERLCTWDSTLGFHWEMSGSLSPLETSRVQVWGSLIYAFPTCI